MSMILMLNEFDVWAFARDTYQANNPLVGLSWAFAGAPGSNRNVNWPLLINEPPTIRRKDVSGGVTIAIGAKVIPVGGGYVLPAVTVSRNVMLEAKLPSLTVSVISAYPL